MTHGLHAEALRLPRIIQRPRKPPMTRVTKIARMRPCSLTALPQGRILAHVFPHGRGSVNPAMRHAYFDENASSHDLHQRSLRGGAISIVAQGVNVLVQVVSTIVLARLLLPEDFGLVAMVSA